LQELVEENAKLRKLLVTCIDKLSPEKVAAIKKQYEEIRALAASAGLELEPLPVDANGKPAPAAAAATVAAKPTAPAPTAPPAAAAAPAVDPNAPKKKVMVKESKDVVSFSFDGADQPAKAAAKPKKASRWAAMSDAAEKAAAKPAAAAAAPATPAKAETSTAKPPAAPPANGKTNGVPAPGSAAAVVAGFKSGAAAKPPPAPAAAAVPKQATPTQSPPAAKPPAAAAPQQAKPPAAPAAAAAASAPKPPPAPAAAALAASQAKAASSTAAPKAAAPSSSPAAAGSSGRPAAAAPAAAAPAAAAPQVAVTAAPSAAAGSSSKEGGGKLVGPVAAAAPGGGESSSDEEEEEVVVGPDSWRKAPVLTAEQKAARAARDKLAREAAEKEVQAHSPLAVAEGRHSWMILTVPEKPVAGADCVVYFNRAQSEMLWDRNRLQMILGFNAWEVQADRKDFGTSPIPHVEGSDFWMTRFRVPEDVYEINFVVTDCEGKFENNAGQDFTYPVMNGLSWEEWQDSAEERAMKAEEERQALEEQRAKEEAIKAREAAENMDKDTAKRRVAEIRDNHARMQENALTRSKLADGTGYWTVSPQPPKPGSKATILYNSKAGPLKFLEGPEARTKTAMAELKKPRFVYGFNNWGIKPEPIEMALSTLPAVDGELWWEVSVELPKDAVNMVFVVNFEGAWDNNGQKDHRVQVALPSGYKDIAEWAESFYEEYYKEEKKLRLEKEEAARKKEELRLKKREQAVAISRAVLRRQLKHVLFTEPEVINAGQKVTVYYCPDTTALAGRQQLYITAGFNRWNHRKNFAGVEMEPPGPLGSHWSTTFKVPKDAHILDFVFSDVPSGDGTYDNRGGLDYHLPIEGGIGPKPKPLHVVHVAVEMAPIAKVGGLGDVVTALGRAVKEEGHQVEVILPRYDFFLHSPVVAGQMQFETEFDWGGTRIVVTTGLVENLRVFFIEPRNGFFATPTVYGRYDDEVRFDFFCKAALEFLLKTGRQPDILHCHDWSTAHVAPSFWNDYQPYGLWKPKVVFTIHNLNYGQKRIGEAAFFCQKFTTVSPTYAFEVGSHPIIAPNVQKFMGIRNGIDTDIWSPDDNPYLPVSYTADTIEEGKARARERLRQMLNLTSWQDKPICAVVSRLTPQKGVHLIKHAAYKTLERGGQFVLLGSAPDPKVQAEFDEIANEMGHGQDAGFRFCYDEPLSHLIYAAADILLVPSMFEPCGLTQMIAMRYGTIPVVRHTGGLRDTVFDVDTDKERAAWEVYGSTDYMADGVDGTNGFAFEGTDTGAEDWALNRALDAFWNDRPWFRSLQKRVMQQDWSWNRPAIDYTELYYSVTKQ